MRFRSAMCMFVAACGGEDPGATCDETCVDPQQCSMTCKGENYDVDNDPFNCCEVADSPVGNHLQAPSSATYIGGLPCDDEASDLRITGRIPSDQRVHTNPEMNGFDVVTGAAPDYVRLLATGGLCVNDINLSLHVAGSTIPDCYRLSVILGAGMYECQTSAGGLCSIARGIGSYPDGAEIYLKIAKTCDSASLDDATYTITGHL